MAHDVRTETVGAVYLSPTRASCNMNKTRPNVRYRRGVGSVGSFHIQNVHKKVAKLTRRTNSWKRTDADYSLKLLNIR